MVGLSEWLVIASVIFVLFSFKKLPDIFLSVAQSIKSFKKGLKEEDKRPIKTLNESKES